MRERLWDCAKDSAVGVTRSTTDVVADRAAASRQVAAHDDARAPPLHHRVTRVAVDVARPISCLPDRQLLSRQWAASVASIASTVPIHFAGECRAR